VWNNAKIQQWLFQFAAVCCEHLDRPTQNERGPSDERRFNGSSAGSRCAPDKSGEVGWAKY